MTETFRTVTAKWAHLGFSITDEDLAVLKRDLAAGDCDLCSFPVVFQLIGGLEDARRSAEPERRQAEPPIIGYHERPGDQLALGEVITEPIRGATRSCPRCGTHTRWTGYAWEHMSKGMTGAGQLSCPIPPVESRPCGCKVWPCQHEGAYLLDGEPLATEPATAEAGTVPPTYTERLTDCRARVTAMRADIAAGMTEADAAHAHRFATRHDLAAMVDSYSPRPEPPTAEPPHSDLGSTHPTAYEHERYGPQ